MRNLVITGFMATGKSTVGRLVAQRCGLPLVDTDLEIERRTGRSIAAIFSESGEDFFRRLEREVLAHALDGQGQVIATGGGTLLPPESRDLLREGDQVVCLTCSSLQLQKRIESSPGRPLLPEGEHAAIEVLLARRQEVYALFEQVDTTDIDASEVAASVAVLAGCGEVARYAVEQRRESTVLFERGAISRVESWSGPLRGTDQVLVVTDETVWNAGLVDPIVLALKRCVDHVDHVCIPAGEEYKDFRSLETLYRACMECRLERRAAIVGVGGGVICDIAALVAATYLRGLRLALVPTTLLSQVDAAIGGKAAIDLAGAKNLIGAFYPADAVVIDPDTLDSLPETRLAEGLAEVVKIALVRSRDLFERLESLASAPAVLQQADIIRVAAVEKIRVVREDPLEYGIRALLNFGHTVGHALEAASGYSLSHGEAVSAGMVAETWLAESLGVCAAGVLPRLCAVLQRLDLPHVLPDLDVDLALRYMQQDKKRVAGALRFALPTAIGEGVVVKVAARDARRAVEHAVRETL